MARLCLLAGAWLVCAMMPAARAEDAQPPRTAADPQPAGDPQLARDVIEKVRKSYFLLTDHARRFTAVYNVLKKDKVAGTVTVTWAGGAGSTVKAEVKAKEGESLARNLKNLVETAWWSSLLTYYGYHEMAATKTAEGFRVVWLKPSEHFKSLADHYATDYRLLKRVGVGGRGAKLLRTYKTLDNPAGRLIESMTFDVDSWSTYSSGTTQWAFTYDAVKGLPFIQRIEILEERGEYIITTTRCKLVRTSVDLQKAAPAVTPTPGEPPQQEGNWDALTGQVLAKVHAANYSMTQLVRHYSAAGYTVDVLIQQSYGTPFRAALNVAWKDADNDGKLADSEITITGQGPVNPMIELTYLAPIRKKLKEEVSLSLLDRLKQCTVTARRTDGGHVLTVKPQGIALPAQELTFSDDFRLVRATLQHGIGTKRHITYTHKKHGDRWLMTGSTDTIPAGSMATTEKTTVLWQTSPEGLPISHQITVVKTIQTAAGRVVTTQRYTRRNWRATKRATPLAPAGGD